MSDVVHSTITVEREFAASPERVFAAWSDPKQRAQWDVPGEGWELVSHRQDFRVGGEEEQRFGPKGDPAYRSAGHFLDIVPQNRIISAGTMHDKSGRQSCTLCTIEITPTAKGARLKLTDQSAFFGGETAQMREEGWHAITDKLAAHLA